MTFPKDSLVLLDIAGKHARVFCNLASGDQALSELGFSKVGDLFVRSVADDVDRKALVVKLAAKGCLFSAGKDWSPAELAAYYQENGLAIGAYRVISWRAPDNFVITTNPT